MTRLLLYIVFIFFFISCKKKTAENNASETPAGINTVSLDVTQLKNAGIATGKLEKQSIANTTKVTGIIDVPPQNIVSVSAPMGGYLVSTQLLPGMKIQKGQVLATLEDQRYIDLQQEYLLHQTNLKIAEQEYNRQKELNLNQAASDKMVQQAENEMRKLKINIAAISEKLKIINIDPSKLDENNITRRVHLYSSINGYVSHVDVNIGKYLNPSDILFQLINPTDIHLNLKIFEKDIDKLFVGQKLDAYTNHDPNKKHKCAIILIGKNVSDDHSIEVHCHFEDYDKNLIPGMYMNADLHLSNKDSYTLPEDAVLLYENKNYIFLRTESGQYEMKEVQTGLKQNGQIAILNAETLLTTTIVTKGAYGLLMALKNNEEL